MPIVRNNTSPVFNIFGGLFTCTVLVGGDVGNTWDDSHHNR